MGFQALTLTSTNESSEASGANNRDSQRGFARTIAAADWSNGESIGLRLCPLLRNGSTMAVLAFYVPKPEQLTESITILVFAFLVLCGVASWMKLSVAASAFAMLVGTALALTPDLLSLWNTDLHDYGDTAREWSSTDHSDTFFAITSYMFAGRGKLVAAAGMAAGFGGSAVLQVLVRRKRQSNAVQQEYRETGPK
jgi:hypothetical protein